MLGNYTVHQEQKLIKLYQVGKHFLKAEKINDGLYSIEHKKNNLSLQNISVLEGHQDPTSCPAPWVEQPGPEQGQVLQEK